MKDLSKRVLPEKIFLIPVFILLLIVAMTRGVTCGVDFRVFYAAAQNFHEGKYLYGSEQSLNFKYAPLAAWLFSPLSHFDFLSAKRLYLVFLAVAITILPFLAIRVLRVSKPLSPRAVAMALAVGILGSLRFLDNEIQSAQTNAFSLLFILLALNAWVSPSAISRMLGCFSFAVGSLFKFHPLFALGIFLSKRNGRTLAALSIAVILLALFPHPSYWSGWLDHIRSTNKEFPMLGNHAFLGFFPMAVNYFGVVEDSLWPFVFFLPVGLWALWRVPKFSLFPVTSETTDHSAAFLLGMGGLLLLALSLSRLPWHHTYIPLWAFIPTSYLCATRLEKRCLMFFAAVLGLTPWSIVGREISHHIEVYQIPFFAALGIAVLLIRQSRRLQGTVVASEAMQSPR